MGGTGQTEGCAGAARVVVRWWLCVRGGVWVRGLLRPRGISGSGGYTVIMAFRPPVWTPVWTIWLLVLVQTGLEQAQNPAPPKKTSEIPIPPLAKKRKTWKQNNFICSLKKKPGDLQNNVRSRREASKSSKIPIPPLSKKTKK